MSSKYRNCKNKEMGNCSKTNKVEWFRVVGSFCLLVIAVAGGIHYLSLVNKQTTVGYRVSKLENKVEELRERKEGMELVRIDLGQADRVENGAIARKMEIVNEVGYVDLGEEVMVMLKR